MYLFKKKTGEHKYLISRYETKVEVLKRSKMSTIGHEIEQHLLCVHALSEEVSTFFLKHLVSNSSLSSRNAMATIKILQNNR